jgi:phage terminase large subunit GpA-like protein
MIQWQSSIPEQSRRWLRPMMTNNPPSNIWQWATANVDFGLVPNYDTPLHERYDPNFMPFWNEPAEGLTDPAVKEVVALKCARAGGSENLLLNPIRYSVAVRPQPTLYVTGDQLSAERMMEKRIVRGLRASRATRAKLNAARVTQHDIEFADMDLRVTWPKAKQAFKQDGWSLVLCDEVSTWPEFSADMARKRTASYPFAHIAFISSPDPQQKRSSDEDPIFQLYKRGDQRKWNCTDPLTGNAFVFELGTQGTGHGLKWDESARNEDGDWDYDKVAKTAHYVTPDGTRIEERDRMGVVRQGQWVATAPGSDVRSYHVTAFMTPFDSLGGIAVAFLKAKHAGKQALRVFWFEYLALEWGDEIEKIYESSLDARQGTYLRGSSAYIDNAGKWCLMTVDVQKDHMWWVVRHWMQGGDSCLVDWGRCFSWDDVDEIAAKHRPEYIGVDSGDGQRTHEIYIESLERQYIPMKGDDKSKPGLQPWIATPVNPHQGTRRQREGETVMLTVFHTDTYRLKLASRIRGEGNAWQVYRGIDRDYILQITAEQRGPQGWVRLRRDNHAFDCETMQIALAESQGILNPPAPEPEAA